MKKMIFAMLLLSQMLSAGIPSQILKSAAKMFSKGGENYGIKLMKVSRSFGDDAASYVAKVEKRYGSKGLHALAKYGDKTVVSSPNALVLVSRYKDEGYYLLKRSAMAPRLFGKYGDSYVKMSSRFGVKRVSQWLADADVKGKGREVLRYLEDLGTKAAVFYEKNWGKLLVTGFVGLNAGTILAYGKDIGVHTLDKGADVAVGSVESISRTLMDSPLVYALMFALMAYTLLSLWIRWHTYMSASNSNRE